MRTRTFVAAGSIAALSFGLASVGVAAAPAFAAAKGGGVTAVTHTGHHADTTTASGPCLGSSTNGPVWAYDNLSFRFRVTSTGSDTYSVTIDASGSFTSFANRFTGTCTVQRGSVRGWLQYTVTSSTGPDPAALPAQEGGTVSQTTMLSQLFQGTVSITGGGAYSYTYTLVTGSPFVTAG